MKSKKKNNKHLISVVAALPCAHYVVMIYVTGSIERHSTVVVDHQLPVEPIKKNTVQMNIGITPDTQNS